MTYSAAFESTLLDLVTFVIMVPINLVYGLLWLLELSCKACAPYRRYIGWAVALAAFLAVCVVVPNLFYGLGFTAVFALLAYPGKTVR